MKWSVALAGDDRMEPLLVICGPTAGGKSALALRLADELPVTIVSADSRQIYQGFDVGTAKPSAAERRAVPHAGIDLVAPDERYSAFAWAEVAAQAIRAARAAGRIPLVVGGAGFYLRALVTPAPGVVRYDARYILVDPGTVLRERIAGRVDAMLRAGWMDEVRRLVADVAAEAPAWQASGYAAVRELACGRHSLEAGRERAIVATRQYAKRQRTWFRHQIPLAQITALDPTAYTDSGVAAASRWLRQREETKREERGERHTVTAVGDR
jgi:tRNA A37 N6-isopentenylltransferase MiaA